MSDTTAESDQTAGPFSRFEWMLAGRYLRARRKEAFISVISWLTLISIAIGVATLIVVMSVMNGFRAELLTKILGLNAARVYGVEVGAKRCAITDDELEKATATPRTGNVGPRTHDEYMAGIEHELALRAGLVR